MITKVSCRGKDSGVGSSSSKEKWAVRCANTESARHSDAVGGRHQCITSLPFSCRIASSEIHKLIAPVATSSGIGSASAGLFRFRNRNDYFQTVGIFVIKKPDCMNLGDSAKMKYLVLPFILPLGLFLGLCVFSHTIYLALRGRSRSA